MKSNDLRCTFSFAFIFPFEFYTSSIIVLSTRIRTEKHFTGLPIVIFYRRVDLPTVIYVQL